MTELNISNHFQTSFDFRLSDLLSVLQPVTAARWKSESKRHSSLELKLLMQ